MKYSRKFYSQNEEDGIISEIFDHIGTSSRRFVEIGASGGLENNTVRLLLRGWSGEWIEGVPELADQIRTRFSPLIANRRLSVLNEFVNPELARRLDQEGHFTDIDLFSIDIDGNDYHIVMALENLDARVVMSNIIANFCHPISLL